MPHFILECSQNVLSLQDPEEVMLAVMQAAESTGLFTPADIKVRIKPYEMYLVAGDKRDFIHVFGNIMQGRSEAKKRALSEAIVKRLKELFPEVPIVSMNIREFTFTTYHNRNTV